MFSYSCFTRADDRFRAVCDLQFCEDARDIILYSLDTQGEPVRNCQVILSLRDQI